MSEGRTRRSLATRMRILEAARDLFISDGFDAVSMRRIAAKVDYTVAALYRHFPDKSALFQEILSSGGSAFHADPAKSASTDPVERVRLECAAYVEFGLKWPGRYRLLFLSPPNEVAELDRYSGMRSAVQDAIAAGRFRPLDMDIDDITRTLWAAMHGVVSLHIARGGDPRRARQAAGLLARAVISEMQRQ